MAIRSFAGEDIERFFREGRTPRRAGRVVFRWTASGPSEVDVRDYH